jgi:uncharacterized membrane protein YhiD involved in acid resistance
MANDIVTIFSSQIALLAKAAVSLPIAAALSAALAFRPRRKGTPQRDLEVVHTQIILGVISALVMLVIGDSLARAFGIVGAAGLIRYRARIEDPKDAGVMLSTLGLGLASGVGLYLLAAFATIFLLLVLWFVESHTPKALVPYRLKVSTSEPMMLQPKIEAVLSSHRLEYGLRNYSHDELDYDVQIPSDQPTDKISSALQELESAGGESFTWRLKKEV